MLPYDKAKGGLKQRDSSTEAYFHEIGDNTQRMTKSELNKFRNILEAKQVELEQDLRRHDGINIHPRTSDPLDEVQSSQEREIAISNLDRESNLLRQVRAALARMKDNTYGICVDGLGADNHEIAAKRLNAVPWAARCINCEEALTGAQRVLDAWSKMDLEPLTA